MNNRPLYECDRKPMTPKKRSSTNTAMVASATKLDSSASSQTCPSCGVSSLVRTPPLPIKQQNVQEQNAMVHKDLLPHLPASSQSSEVYYPRRGGGRQRSGKQGQRVRRAMTGSKAKVAFIVVVLVVSLVLYAGLLGQAVETHDAVWQARDLLRDIRDQVNRTVEAMQQRGPV